MNDILFRKHLAQTTPFPMVIEVEKAAGSVITAKDGKEYIDMVSGLSVSNFGHGHPRIKEAIHEQTEMYLHVMVYGEFRQDAQERCALNLCSLLPSSLDTVYFVNSGTEANEAAIKLAKRSTGRSKIIAFKGAYHGSTHGSMSISFNESKKRAYRPLLPGIDFIGLNHFEDLEKIDHSVAAVVLETIQGDAGIRIPTERYLNALQQKCKAHGVLLVFDEIQSGMGRTGKNFAFEHFGVVPDILTLGKALGGGLPIGALVASRKEMEHFSHDPMLGHITTFGGNPLICAAADAALSVLKEEINFLEVEKTGDLIEKTLKNHQKVLEIRRKGLFIAIELSCPEEVQKVVEYSLENGVILFWFLSSPQAFRIAPPLNISEDETTQALSIITQALNTI